MDINAKRGIKLNIPFKTVIMSIEVVTREDLLAFRQQLLADIKALLQSRPATQKEWLRSSEVRKLLKISRGTLQNMRINGQLKPSKIGGIYYYSYGEIEKLLGGIEERML